MAIVDVLKWDDMKDQLVWKYPSNELGTWTQLIVNESQQALFLKDGKLIHIFDAGSYTLNTENYPFIRELFKLPFGGKSPFAAEVWFVNKTSVMDIKWGTAQPVELQDPKYGIIVPLTAHGQFGLKVKDSEKFYKTLVGSNFGFDVEKLRKYLKGIIYSYAKNNIADAVIKVGKSPFELNSYLIEIGNYVKEDIQKGVENLGVEIENFYVSGIQLPEDHSEVNRLRAALAKKAEMDIIGYTYQQEKSFETMNTAVSKGRVGTSGIIDAGLELGMGMKIANGLGGSIGKMLEPLESVKSGTCIECQKPIEENSKFCKHCGATQTITCSGCGKTYKEQITFCSDCGKRLKEVPSNGEGA